MVSYIVIDLLIIVPSDEQTNGSDKIEIIHRSTLQTVPYRNQSSYPKYLYQKLSAKNQTKKHKKKNSDLNKTTVTKQNIIQQQQLSTFTERVSTALSNEWIVPALICIGVKKGGTTSLNFMLNRHIPELWSNIEHTEFHYFERNCYPKTQIIGLDYFTSLNTSLMNYYKYCSTERYKKEFILSFLTKNHKSDYNINSTYLFEKTPDYIMYPHVAYIIINDFVKYGTKIFVLLRNPVERFISDCFQSNKCYNLKNGTERKLTVSCLPITNLLRFYYGYGLNKIRSMDELPNTLEDVKSRPGFPLQSFSRFIDNMANKQDINDIHWLYISRNYTELFYKFHNSKVKRNRYLLWTRGCYAPQLLAFLFHAEQLGLYDSVKIIQSEQLFNPSKAPRLLTSLRCFIHLNDDEVRNNYRNYSEWMDYCLDEGSSYWIDNVTYGQRNRMTRDYDRHPLEFPLLYKAYESCNKLLRIMLEKRFKYSIMGEWDWDLWEKIQL